MISNRLCRKSIDFNNYRCFDRFTGFWRSFPVYYGSLIRIHDPKLRILVHALSLSVFIAFKGTNLHILFVITAVGVVPSGGPKMSPRTSSVVQIIFYLWFFEINETILRVQKLVLCLDHIYVIYKKVGLNSDMLQNKSHPFRYSKEK